MSAEKDNSFIWKIINRLSKNEPLECSDEELKAFVTDELELDVSKLNTAVRNNLSVVLLAYINTWPGWDMFKGRQILEVYYNQLKTYLRYKFAKPRNKAFYDSLGNRSADKMSLATGTGTSEFAPLNIQINCPPSIMNSLVFTVVKGELFNKCF